MSKKEEVKKLAMELIKHWEEDKERNEEFYDEGINSSSFKYETLTNYFGSPDVAKEFGLKNKFFTMEEVKDYPFHFEEMEEETIIRIFMDEVDDELEELISDWEQEEEDEESEEQ